VVAPLDGVHHRHAVHVAVVLVGAVGRISQQGLHCVVDLVSVCVGRHFLQGRVHPVGVAGSVPELIVLNHLKALLESHGVYVWVEGISSGIENVESRSGSSELFSSEVFVELASCKVVVALGGLVVPSLELLLELVDVGGLARVSGGSEYLPFI